MAISHEPEELALAEALPPAHYVVGQLYTDKASGKRSLYREEFFGTVGDALADYNKRHQAGENDLIICKVLQVRTVLVDYDAAGRNELPF